jgi:hypothetical protein
MNRTVVSEIEAIASAVEIDPPSRYRFAGRPFGPVPAPTQPMPGIRASSNPAIDHLAGTFYQHCYTRRFRGELRDDPREASGYDLTASLSAANAGRDRWDVGWEVVQLLPNGQVQARKGTLERAFWPGEYLTHDAPGMPPRPGLRLSVFLPRESSTIQPGFYFAFSETPVDPLDGENIVRFYWNVGADWSPILTRNVTHALNRFRVPFRFKCLANSAHYGRLDSAVLFVNKKHFHVTAELLQDVYLSVRDGLGDETPLFARRLAPGLALAEDPGGGESFGMSRCRMLAEALWDASAHGLLTGAERMSHLRSHLARQGVSLDQPHATSGFAPSYDDPAFPG